MTETRPPSIYRYAAAGGFRLAPVLCAASACFLLGNRLPSAPMFALPALAAVPVVLIVMMRSLLRQRPDLARFSPLWLFGIYCFIFASLICSLFTGCYLIFVEPHFLSTSLSNAVAGIKAAGLEAEFSSQILMMETAIEKKAIPAPMQFVSSMAWTTCFFGSMLSMAAAWLVAASPRRKAIQ